MFSELDQNLNLINLILILFNRNKIMRSKSSARSGMCKIYQVEEVLSNSFIVNWIFIVKESLINKTQKQTIQKLYSKALRVEKDGAISFNPLRQNKTDFLKNIKKINNGTRMIKVVADSQNAHSILTTLKKQQQLDLITQLYVFSPVRAQDYLTARLKEQFPELVKIRDNLNEIIKVAQQQIEKWRLKFQILRNLLPLSGASQERAYQWRIRLRACDSLKPSKFDHQLLQFDRYISEEIECRKLWDEGYQKRASHKRSEIIQNLKKAIQNLKQVDQRPNEEQTQKVKKLREQKIAKSKAQFIIIMLKLYKDQTIFYQIINQGLKKFIKKSFEWEKLALPICLMCKAIKMAYENQEKANVQEKINDEFFIVWRGGKISEKQLSQIKQNWVNSPYYQFFSFISTSQDLNVAVKFLKNTEKQAKKYNCLFKFIVKNKPTNSKMIHQQFFNRGYCRFPTQIDNNQQEILLNTLTVGKIIALQELNWNELKNNFNLNKNNIPESDLYQKVRLITIQIGTFQQLFRNVEMANSLSQKRRISQQKQKYKAIIEHYLYTIDIIKKYQNFDFADAYELCNQMQKSYKYLTSQIQDVIQQNYSMQIKSEQKISLIYSQSDIYSRLSDICRKMGRLSQALLYNENAIQKVKQLENIDLNRSFNLYQQKLNKMYLKSSHMLIETHHYSEASRKIQTRIQELKEVQDQKQKQRNKVIISRLLLDLGVTNFKQGKLQKAQQIFAESAQNIQKIYKFINYDYLNEETHFFSWLHAVFNDPDIKLLDGPQVFYKRKREANIAAITAVYGGQERLRETKKSAKSLELQTSQVVVNHKQYFCDVKQYEELINQIQQKVNQKLKNQQTIPQEIFLSKNKQKLSKQQQSELVRTIAEKKIGNHYDRMKQQMNKQLLYEEKQNYNDIIQQQANILNQRQKIQNLRRTFWQNPQIYIERIDQFKQQFGDLYLKKQELNRQKMLILQSNDEITMQELILYYKKSANSINNYISQLEKWGYSQSAPKILQQYNSLIQLYIQINYSQDAQQKIEQVKRLGDIKGEQKYYQMAVAYFLKGKIYEASAQIDFLIVLQPSNSYTYQSMKLFQRQRVKAAIKEFQTAQDYFKKALIKNENGRQNWSVYQAEPQQLQLKIWVAKCLLILFELQQSESQSNKLLSKVDRIIGDLHADLKKINTINKFELRAEALQVQAIYEFRRKQYKKSLECFDQCIQVRIEKIGDFNWQNTLTYIKVIYLFHMADSIQQKLMNYVQILQKNYTRYKNYPFYWKICLAHYYLSKQCENHQAQHALSYMEDALIFMEKIGFAEEHFFRQYELIYDNQYSSFYNKKKPYLNRPKHPKKQRNIKKYSQQQKEQDRQFDQLLQYTEINMMKSKKRLNRKKSINQRMALTFYNNPESAFGTKLYLPSLTKTKSQFPSIQNKSFYGSGLGMTSRMTRDSSHMSSKRQMSTKLQKRNNVIIEEKTNPRIYQQHKAKRNNNFMIEGQK